MFGPTLTQGLRPILTLVPLRKHQSTPESGISFWESNSADDQRATTSTTPKDTFYTGVSPSRRHSWKAYGAWKLAYRSTALHSFVAKKTRRAVIGVCSWAGC